MQSWDVTIGTVSWINGAPNPMTFAGEATLYSPDWVPKTYLGLVATKNSDPGERIADFPVLRKGKDFRAMTFAHLTFEADEQTGAISNFSLVDSFYDPGYTPPFKLRKWPTAMFSFDKNVFSFTYYAGEASPLSDIVARKRHPNSTITGVPASETILVNGMVKFRAGKHTDDVGVNTVGAPFHVPWVWCEVLATFAAGKVKLYGRSSVFPSHAWYLDGKRVAKSNEIGDATFPKQRLIPRSMPRPIASGLWNAPNPLAIDVESLILYPVLSAGASAAAAQTPLDADKGLTTPVDQHPNAVKAITMVTN